MHGLKPILIKNSTVIDGTGAPAFESDVLVADGRIARVARDIAPPEGALVIDAAGMYVTPGFIDAHGHSEFSMYACPEADGRLAQGVTCEVIGNCGMSAAPLIGPAATQREPDLVAYGIPGRWRSLDEYIGMLQSRNPSINVLTLAGHGNIRASVMGYEDRRPTESELSAMKDLLTQCIVQGACGMSSGLIYPPGIYSDTAELAALCAHGAAVREGFIYTTHMRSESDALLESINEAIAMGRASGARVHISHIKTADRRNWHKAAAAIELIEKARAEGVRVTCDRYPYTASATDLDAIFPAWMFEGGRQAETARLKDAGTLRKLARAMDEIEGTDPDVWEGIVISSVSGPLHKDLEGMSVGEASRNLGLAPFDAVVRLLLDSGLRVGAIFHCMSEDNLRRFLGLPYVMVGSDSSSRCSFGLTRSGRPHPRGFGAFPRYFSIAREIGLPIEEAVRKVSSLPAETFGISGRGLIREGFHADLAVIDMKALRDRATYADPYELAEGVAHVLVNGALAFSAGRVSPARPGLVLRASERQHA